MICNECKEVFEQNTPERARIVDTECYDRFTCTPCVESLNKALYEWLQSEEGLEYEEDMRKAFCLAMSWHVRISHARQDAALQNAKENGDE